MWKFPHQWFRKYTVCMCVVSRLWECMYGYDTIQVVVLYVCMFINHDQQLLWGGFICAGTPVFSRGLASLSGGWIQCSNWNIGNPKPSLLSLIARSRRMNRESSTARQSFFIVCIHLRNFANATSSSSSHNFWLGKVHNIPVPSLLWSIISEYSYSTHTRTRREWNRHHTFYTQLYSMPNKRINQNHSLITILLLQELWPMNQK